MLPRGLQKSEIQVAEHSTSPYPGKCPACIAQWELGARNAEHDQVARSIITCRQAAEVAITTYPHLEPRRPDWWVKCPWEADSLGRAETAGHCGKVRAWDGIQRHFGGHAIPYVSKTASWMLLSTTEDWSMAHQWHAGGRGIRRAGSKGTWVGSTLPERQSKQHSRCDRGHTRSLVAEKDGAFR